jgi:hypothetical protein
MRIVGYLVAAAILLGTAAPAGASLLSDLFGVTLSVDGTGTFDNVWAPISSTADYFVDDNWSTYHVRAPFGGEQFDIEAIYFDDDATNAYVAVVTSLPLPMGRVFLNELVIPGDLGIDLGLGSLDLGIDIDGGTGQVADTDAADWFQSNTNFLAEVGPTNFAGGVPLGFAGLSFYDYGLVERGYGTYVFEVTVSKSLLGSPGVGSFVGLDWTMGCRNDVIRLNGDFDGAAPPPVPEPGTLLLLGAGLLGIAGTVRRKLR